MGSQWSQFFPPKPNFSEIGSLDGKVFIVTGGASGIGYELTKMLYQRGGHVYIAGRSESKVRAAIEELAGSTPAGTPGAGKLDFLHLELDDLTSIKASVDEFKSKETKLHVLWNNAGVSRPPVGSSSKQGLELQLATNCLGPFLFTQLLLPLMQATASTETEDGRASGSVRVVWTSSQSVELTAPNGGIIMSELHHPPADATRLYNNSKAGNMFLASELARRHGIASVSANPGAASTNLFRHTPYVQYLAWPLLHKPAMAALTQLFAGVSKDIGEADLKGGYIIPWGRVSANLRDDLREAMKLPEEGGSGRASEFWDFCMDATSKFH